ncbi:MAG: hypothetical protein K5842_03295 [Bacteroidales bacterium]|nr:hypothetical protein [Bacteroidales bacterium]
MSSKKRFCLLFVLLLLATGCSRNGVHMSKHRKSRKCNCPTFTYYDNATQGLQHPYFHS